VATYDDNFNTLGRNEREGGGAYHSLSTKAKTFSKYCKTAKTTVGGGGDFACTSEV